MAKIESLVRDSLQSIVHPRFYETERGFQGEFGAELRKRLHSMEILNDHFVEHEYQKTLKDHGLAIRPDLVIHIPFDDDIYECRREGNHAVIELKLRSNEVSAHGDYYNLGLMIEKLDYDVGIFINISSSETFLKSYQGHHKDRMRAFGVTLEHGSVILHE